MGKAVKREKEPKAEVPTVRIRGSQRWHDGLDKILLSMKSNGRTWKEIAEFLDIPGTTCKDRYYKLVQKATVWDDEMDIQLQKAYQQSREAMWKLVGEKVGVFGEQWKTVSGHLEERKFSKSRLLQ